MLLSLAAAEPAAKPFSVRSLAFSPDGKILAASGWIPGPPGATIAWDVETKKELWRRPSGAGFVAQSFSADGKTLAITHNKPTVLRLDAVTGRELGELGPHPKVVRAAVHIPGCDLLATGSDGVIRFWDLKTGKVAFELAGHPAEVSWLLASPDGKWLISTGPDGTHGWYVAARSEIKDAFRADGGTHYSGIVFVAANRVLMGSNWGNHRIIELPSGREVLRFKNSGGSEGGAYSPAAGLAAYRWHDKPEASIADLAFRAPTAAEKAQIEKLLKDFDDDSYDVRVAASAAMKKIGSVAEPALSEATAKGASAEVRMRARETRKAILDEPLRKLTGHAGAIGPMAFSPNGKLLATGAEDGTVRLWDPQTGTELARLAVASLAAK